MARQYTVRVAESSRWSMVTSAGLHFFKDIPRYVTEDDPCLAELQANELLEVVEVAPPPQPKRRRSAKAKEADDA